MSDEPSFDAPWQAQAFGLVVALQEAGVVGAREWAAALGAELAASDAADDGADYYDHWVTALGRLLAAKGIVGVTDVDALAASWQRAAHATPHGQPITLDNDPAR